MLCWSNSVSRDEHRNRSPDCPFFTFVAPKKTGRGKGARASKASRASVQSNMGTFISEGPSTMDATAEVDDSVITTASKRGRGRKTKAAAETSTADVPAEVDDSVVTTASKRGRGRKATRAAVAAEESTLDATAEVDDSVLTTASKRGRPKKAAAAKGRKTRAKKEPEPEPEPEREESQVPQEETMQEEAPVSKPKRGKKRASEAVDDSNLTATEAPAPKRRATRAKTRGSNTASAPAVSAEEDVDMDTTTAEPPKKAGRKKVARRKHGLGRHRTRHCGPRPLQHRYAATRCQMTMR